MQSGVFLGGMHDSAAASAISARLHSRKSMCMVYFFFFFSLRQFFLILRGFFSRFVLPAISPTEGGHRAVSLRCTFTGRRVYINY